MRVLKWMLDRCEGRAAGRETVLGVTPAPGELETAGLQDADVAAATRIDLKEWEAELESQAEWFQKLGKTLPPALELQRQMLLQQVRASLGAGR
jgi:phosphoenolpyruvate carboxykinase (GTP)